MTKTVRNFSFLLVLAALVSCGGTSSTLPTTSATPKEIIQIQSPGTISKSYFENDTEASTFTIDMYDYINPNGVEGVEFIPTCSNKDCVTLTVEDGHIIKGVLNDVQGNFSLTVQVKVKGVLKKALTFSLQATEIKRVACIGDSLTAGHSWSKEAYPVYLQQEFTSNITVNNYGKNGANITSYGGSGSNYQYTKLAEYTNSKNFKPNVAVIMLGTNDATQWANAKATFTELYRSSINEYLAINAQVIIVTSPPTIYPNEFSIPNEEIKNYVNPIQREIAEELDLPLVDAREAFESHPDGISSLLRSDKVHLSVKGAQFIADLIAEKIKTL